MCEAGAGNGSTDFDRPRALGRGPGHRAVEVRVQGIAREMKVLNYTINQSIDRNHLHVCQRACEDLTRVACIMADVVGPEIECTTDTIPGLSQQAGAWSDQHLLDWLHASTKRLDAKFSRTDAAISELAAASADLEARVQNAVARMHMLSQSNFIEHVPPPPPSSSGHLQSRDCYILVDRSPSFLGRGTDMRGSAIS